MEIKCLLFHRKAYSTQQKNSLGSFDLRLCSLAGGVMLSQLQKALLQLHLYYFSKIFLFIQLLTRSTAPTSITAFDCLVSFCACFWTLSPPVPVLLFSLMVQYPSSSSTRTTLDPAHDPPPCISPPAPPFHRAVSLPLPLFLAQHSPSILPLPLMGSLMPKVSKIFAPLQPLLTPSTLEPFGPLLYDNNGGWPLKGSLLPLPHLPLFPRGIKWTKTYNGVGHVARSNLELQVQIWEM